MFYFVLSLLKHQIGETVKNLKESLPLAVRLTAMRYYRRRFEFRGKKKNILSWSWFQQQTKYPKSNPQRLPGTGSSDNLVIVWSRSVIQICLQAWRKTFLKHVSPFYFCIRSSSTHHTTSIIPGSHRCPVLDDSMLCMKTDWNRAQCDLGASKIPFTSSNEPPCDL